MKLFLSLSALVLLSVVSMTSAMANETYIDAGETLIENTEDMAAEAQTEFIDNVDCVNKAVESDAATEMMADDCVSQDISTEYADEMDATEDGLDNME